MNQEQFININYLKSKGFETIQQFQDLYGDLDELKKQIRDTIGDKLSEDDIRDKRVLLKPNWVRHDKKEIDYYCLTTNENFIIAFLEIIFQMKPLTVLIGDAPIQGCDWSKLISDSFLNKVKHLSEKYKTDVLIKDFRRVVFDQDANNLTVEKNPIDEYLIFDVGHMSYLESVTDNNNTFRVTVYNPDRFKESHLPGMHKYCITKELFDADVIISMPKLKTHQKTGITAALKNIVGFNGDKDFLPHHRIGGVGMGGDCYPGKSRLRYWAELALDNANRNKGNYKYGFWSKLGSILWKLSFPDKVHTLEAGWYGNDTTWRMVMDLNLIVMYGAKDGRIKDSQQRKFYSLCDGIIGGQGNGPLNPEPLELGVITFTNASVLNDLCSGILMGMEVDRIPLLVASKDFIYSSNYTIKFNNVTSTFKNLKKYSVKTIMPPGWQDYNK